MPGLYRASAYFQGSRTHGRVRPRRRLRADAVLAFEDALRELAAAARQADASEQADLEARRDFGAWGRSIEASTWRVAIQRLLDVRPDGVSEVLVQDCQRLLGDPALDLETQR
jgi:hypothetical protein